MSKGSRVASATRNDLTVTVVVLKVACERASPIFHRRSARVYLIPMGVPVLPSITAKVTDADRKGVSASYSLSSPRRQAPSDSLDQLSPAPWRGFLCNQRCGWALGWWACVREGSAGPVWQDTKMDPPSPAPLWRGFCLCAPRWNADHRNQCASTSFLAGLARRGLATTTSTFSGPSDRQAYTPPSVGCPAVTQRGVPPATE